MSQTVILEYHYNTPSLSPSAHMYIQHTLVWQAMQHTGILSGNPHMGVVLSTQALICSTSPQHLMVATERARSPRQSTSPLPTGATPLNCNWRQNTWPLVQPTSSWHWAELSEDEERNEGGKDGVEEEEDEEVGEEGVSLSCSWWEVCNGWEAAACPRYHHLYITDYYDSQFNCCKHSVNHPQIA